MMTWENRYRTERNEVDLKIKPEIKNIFLSNENFLEGDLQPEQSSQWKNDKNIIKQVLHA